MLVILLGPRRSGKSTIADILTSSGYTRVRINPTGQKDGMAFDSSSAFLTYATTHWRDNFVCCDLVTRAEVDSFRKRPFVLLVSVEAPIGWRYARAQGTSLEEFIREDDVLHFGESLATSTSSTLQLPSRPIALPHPLPSPPMSRSTSTYTRTPLKDLTPLAHLIIRPALFPSIAALRSHITQLDLASNHRVRPEWDDYFMTLAELASLRSNCMKRRVGAVLISERKTVMSTGYNGTPRGMVNCSEGGCTRCNGGTASGVDMQECLCLHAEENALLEAGRGRAIGGTLYCNTWVFFCFF